MLHFLKRKQEHVQLNWYLDPLLFLIVLNFFSIEQKELVFSDPGLTVVVLSPFELRVRYIGTTLPH